MREFRITEIFGPTIQGEGRRAGTSCYFIRFAGCDYRCSWCDSPHAVLPPLVLQAEKMSEDKIVTSVVNLPGHPNWVVLSGGNPLLFELGDLVALLRTYGYRTMVETQGTVEKEWIKSVPDVCISPKPPSSGNETSIGRIENFLKQFEHRAPKSHHFPYLKVVVFTDEDYEYAREMHKYFEGMCDFYLSVGNSDPGLPTVANPYPETTSTVKDTREAILTQTRALFERVAYDPAMKHVRVSPQLHALVWGNERGR